MERTEVACFRGGELGCPPQSLSGSVVTPNDKGGKTGSSKLDYELYDGNGIVKLTETGTSSRASLAPHALGIHVPRSRPTFSRTRHCELLSGALGHRPWPDPSSKIVSARAALGI